MGNKILSLPIILLAAGQASRMGEPKQLLPWKNSTLLGEAIKGALHAGASPLAPGGEVIVVLGAYATRVGPTIQDFAVDIIYNPDWKEGMSTSIAAGIRSLKESDQRVLIALADQPSFTPGHIGHYRRLSDENPGAIIASPYGQRRGVPAIFPRAFFPELLGLAGDAGARRLLNGGEVPVVIADTEELWDIDDREAYLRRVDW